MTLLRHPRPRAGTRVVAPSALYASDHVRVADKGEVGVVLSWHDHVFQGRVVGRYVRVGFPRGTARVNVRALERP